MKRVRSTLLVMAMIVASFAAGAFVTGAWIFLSPPRPLVRLTVLNDSGFDVEAGKVSVTTLGQTSTVVLELLPNKRETVLHFYMAGDGGYSIEATLTNGQTVKGGGYVQSGNSVTSVIEKSGVKLSGRILAAIL